MTLTHPEIRVEDMPSLDDVVPCYICGGKATLAVVSRCCRRTTFSCGPCYDADAPVAMLILALPHGCPACDQECPKMCNSIPTHYEVGPI